MQRFEEGKTYTTRSNCDHDCIFEMTVVKRTPKTIVVDVKNFGQKRLRPRESGDQEVVFPLGDHSMAPIMQAGRP